MAARNLGSTGRNSPTAQKRRRVARLTLAARQVRGGWVMPEHRTDWRARVRDKVSWRLASWALMLGTRWHREMIAGAIALGMDTAAKRAAEERIDNSVVGEDTERHEP